MPKVSVIVPFNTGEFYLKDCLDSLAAQEFTDYEVLLVLDGYQGNIEHTIGTYRDRMNIRVLETPAGKTGVAAARNMGLDNAAGEYIFFLDSDDYVLEEAIGTMVEVLEKYDKDMVYGKFHYTYYKRDIFLPVYLEQRDARRTAKLAAMEEAASEGEAGEEDSAEGEGEEIEGSDDNEEEKEEENEKDDDEPEELTEEEIEKRERRARKKRNKVRRRAIKLLITKKDRFRNVSVLNKLFKKEKLDELKLRFDEELTYFSDVPFMARFLDNDVRVRKCYISHYIKRRHQDPVKYPALNQIQDERRFPQMIEMFNQTMDAIVPEGAVRRAIDHQLVKYAVSYFAVKMKRSEKDCWREERFDAMSALVKRISKNNLRKEKHWRRIVIKPMQKGNADKVIRVTTRRLAVKKLRMILKRKNLIPQFLYRHFYLKKPLKENTVVFETFMGKSYSDNPKYIYEYLAKNHPGKFELVWAMNKPKKLPFEGKCIKRLGFRYWKYMATAKYFVFNSRQPKWFRKRKGMVFLETWHGTPLKKLAFDMEEVYSATPMYKREIYKQSRAWDYLVSANEFSSKVFRSCFLYEKPMLEYGYPRNDILHSPDRDRLDKEFREKLNLPKYKKTILYAPTWRDDEFYSKGKYKFELKLDLAAMKKALGNDYVVLLRTHYYIADFIDLTEFEGFAYNFSKYDDIAELYLVSDILITDYSSVFFDYANLRRPMLFYTYDLHKYRDVLRGMYIDIEEELPGPLLYTTKEVISAIKDIENVKTAYVGKYDIFYDKYCAWDDGHASENISKKIFGSKL
ncbi:MAG: bifunctional glycosyltransferase family 2 protein/CDP-glycerol:glycerophosphate glycerophosphotransferase [Lachnospiraceae bacterium]|nr:bifunctional glycosyltransferase family 2 protein/CDP-glycerol:glycerophosphate glycerophosphotransferase [Lachnospiraceae bacterium]